MSWVRFSPALLVLPFGLSQPAAQKKKIAFLEALGGPGAFSRAENRTIQESSFLALLPVRCLPLRIDGHGKARQGRTVRQIFQIWLGHQISAKGHEVIQGKHGNIHKDGAGYLIALLLKHGRSLKAALQKLKPFTEVRQLGETEAVLYMSAGPGLKDLEALRGVLRIKKRRECSPVEIARLRALGFKPAPEGPAINRAKTF